MQGRDGFRRNAVRNLNQVVCSREMKMFTSCTSKGLWPLSSFSPLSALIQTVPCSFWHTTHPPTFVTGLLKHSNINVCWMYVTCLHMFCTRSGTLSGPGRMAPVACLVGSLLPETLLCGEFAPVFVIRVVEDFVLLVCVVQSGFR